MSKFTVPLYTIPLIQSPYKQFIFSFIRILLLIPYIVNYFCCKIIVIYYAHQCSSPFYIYLAAEVPYITCFLALLFLYFILYYCHFLDSRCFNNVLHMGGNLASISFKGHINSFSYFLIIFLKKLCRLSRICWKLYVCYVTFSNALY